MLGAAQIFGGRRVRGVPSGNRVGATFAHIALERWLRITLPEQLLHFVLYAVTVALSHSVRPKAHMASDFVDEHFSGLVYYGCRCACRAT
jgi:hypothetical protein